MYFKNLMNHLHARHATIANDTPAILLTFRQFIISSVMLYYDRNAQCVVVIGIPSGQLSYSIPSFP